VLHLRPQRLALNLGIRAIEAPDTSADMTE
jgi:hypothetical protein